MGDIVRYHNDLNKIKLPNFTEQEQNILFGILFKIKNKKANESVEFEPQELLKFSTENLTNKALGDMLVILRDKFFKADFTILIEDQERERIGKEIINLFSSFKLWYPKEDKEYNNLLGVEMVVNPRFEYIINELTANFTAFELAEFVGLSGKYTKTLYRLLKQFRSTGRAYFEWDNFKEIMDIPQDYNMCDIDKRILKPALKELTKERNLFDQTRIPFEKLSYEKKKGNGRGRGGNVIGIEFTFKPENITLQKLDKEVKNKDFDYLKAFQKMAEAQYKWQHYDKKDRQDYILRLYYASFNQEGKFEVENIILEEQQEGNYTEGKRRIYIFNSPKEAYKAINKHLINE